MDLTLFGREFLFAECKNRVFSLKNKKERKEYKIEWKWKGTKGCHREEKDPFQNIISH